MTPTRESVTALKALLHEWYVDGTPPNGGAVGRFAGPLGGKYNGAAPHGFSVWGHSDKLCMNEKDEHVGCNALDLRGPCYDKGGAHWMVREASIYGAGAGRSWHPPAGMHLLRAEVLAYNYVNIVLDAIYMIEDDLKTMSKEDASKRYQTKLDELQSTPPLPETPYYCDPNECLTKPVCFTDYEPHYNKDFSLDAIIVGNHTGWQKIRKDGES